MLVFNEGLPRSGKSYDTVVNHILPALKQGRKVYARLNGLEELEKRRAIADHLGMDMASLDALLIHVPKIEVHQTFVAQANAEGEWVIPAHLVDALFVIDEVHDFYIASRQPIPTEQENFFALHGQFGMDGVILTQSIKRTHSSVRYRIERKNVFQKLTAVGMEGKFTVRRFHATGPDRFELVASETGTYEPIYFPMYKGYGGGAKSTGVYKAGGVSVWKKLRKYGLIMALVVGAGLYGFLHLFSGNGGLAKQPPKVAPAPRTVAAVPAPVAAALSGNGRSAIDTKGMPEEVAYIFNLSDQARARLAALLTGDHGKTLGVIEWRADQGRVLESMTLDQVRELGVSVAVHGYGVKLGWKDKAVIVTAWPLDVPATAAATPTASNAVAGGPPVAPPEASPGAGHSTTWTQNQIATAYIPPEQMKAEPFSDWKPGAH